MNEDKKWSPAKETLGVVLLNTTIAIVLVITTWAIANENLSFSTVQSVVLLTLEILLIGTFTYMGTIIRPWWPRTTLAKESERTRRRVEQEWGTAIKLAQEITSKMDKEVQRRTQANAELGPKDQVINSLSRQTVKTTKAALTLIQAGFPEVAFCLWRTIFEVRVNAEYIEGKTPKVAERFIEVGRMNHLSRIDPESEELQTIKKKWTSRMLKPGNQHGWTGNPPKDLTERAREIGIQSRNDPSQYNEMDVYQLANMFVHSDWTSSTNSIGGSSPDITDGAAEGAGEILYLVLETATKMIRMNSPASLQEELKSDIRKLRTQIKGAPERIRGAFIRMPLTELIGVLPDGRIVFESIKRREEWPKEAEIRTTLEIGAIIQKK